MIEKRAKRKKIFYVPGMISLVFIPLFCFYHFYKVDAFVDVRCMDIYMPTDSIVIKKFLSLNRNYKDFNFNSSINSDQKELKNLQLTLRELKDANDTVNGIKVHFSAKAQYEVYIRVLDIMVVENMPTFIQYKNDFLVVMFPKPKSLKKLSVAPVYCGYWETNKDFFLDKERGRKFEYILSLYKKHWILFLGYLGIVLLNIFTLVKFNKNR